MVAFVVCYALCDGGVVCVACLLCVSHSMLRMLSLCCCFSCVFLYSDVCWYIAYASQCGAPIY